MVINNGGEILLAYGAKPETKNERRDSIFENGRVLNSAKELCEKPPVPSLARLCIMHFWKKVKDHAELMTAQGRVPLDIKPELPNCQSQI
jgi:hypothetical protein